MTAQFNVQRLVNHRAVVSGQDRNATHGSVVLDTTQWDELTAVDRHSEASQAFDAAVTEFFADLIQAAEDASEIAKPILDPATFVVLDEGEDATPGRPRNVVQLNHDSVVLHLIEVGDVDRLVWVNGGLEVLEYSGDQAPAPESNDPASEVTTENLGGLG